MKKSELVSLAPKFEVTPELVTDIMNTSKNRLGDGLGWLYIIPKKPFDVYDRQIEHGKNGKFVFGWKRNEPCYGWFTSNPETTTIGVALQLHSEQVQGKDQAILQEYYEFLMSEQSPWQPMPKVSWAIRDKSGAFKSLVIQNLDVPSRLMINYMIAWRLPFRHNIRWTSYVCWRRLGATVPQAMILSAQTNVHIRGHEYSASPARNVRDDHFLSYQHTEEKFSYMNFTAGRPSIQGLKMSTWRSRGIPNNTIWKHRKPIGPNNKLFGSPSVISTDPGAKLAQTVEKSGWDGAPISVNCHRIIGTGPWVSPKPTPLVAKVLERLQNLCETGEGKVEF